MIQAVKRKGNLEDVSHKKKTAGDGSQFPQADAAVNPFGQG
jgi:hypothetical protein